MVTDGSVSFGYVSAEIRLRATFKKFTHYSVKYGLFILVFRALCGNVMLVVATNLGPGIPCILSQSLMHLWLAF